MSATATKYLVDLNLTGRQIKNGAFDQVAELPGSGNFAGRMVELTTDGCLYKRNQANSAWVKQTIPADIADMVSRSSNAGAANEMLVSAGADKTAKTYTGSDGILKIASGIPAAAVAETDYITPSGSVTLSNKTISGSSNTLSNIGFSSLATADIETTLAGSSAKLARADAIKAYIDSAVAGLGKFVGSHDASGGALPTTGSGAGGAIEAGDYWFISVAGTITGLSPYAVLEIGDVLFAKVDGADEVAEFFALDVNLGYATTTVSGKVELATVSETTAKSSETLAVTPAGLASFTRKYTDDFEIADWSANAITYSAATHGLGATKYIAVQVYESGSPNIKVNVTCKVAAGGDVTIESDTTFDGHIILIA